MDRDHIQTAEDLAELIRGLPTSVIVTNRTAPDKEWLGTRDYNTIEDAMSAIRARATTANKDAETDFELATRKSAHTQRLVKAVQDAANVSRFKPVTKVTKIGEGTPA